MYIHSNRGFIMRPDDYDKIMLVFFALAIFFTIINETY